jgi:hypothetical protein
VSETVLEFESIQQFDGLVFIDGASSAVGSITIVVRKDDTMAVLSALLQAIKIERDTEKMSACFKMCKAFLGRNQ